MNIGLIVKVSKLCNLRCVYCCETPELSNKLRMSVKDIEKMFIHVHDYLKMWDAKHEVTFYWHGGEPFAQPISYWEEILQKQKEVFGESFVKGSILNAVQSNVTLLTEKHIPLLRNFRIGFSFDVINDLRIDAGGKPTAELVKKKVRWLRENGIYTAGIAVISRANLHRVREVARFFINENICFRVIHIDEGLDQIPQIRPVAVSFSEYLQFLKKLYELPEVKLALKNGLRIDPISLARSKLESFLQGHRCAEPDEDLSEEEYLLEVNTDGEVYSPADYPYRNSYGNIFNQTIEELLISQGRRNRVERSFNRLSKICAHCMLFRRSCNGTFVSHATPEQYNEIEESGGCYLKMLAELMLNEGSVRRGGHYGPRTLVGNESEGVYAEP